MREEVLTIGEPDALIGILSQPDEGVETDLPCLLLLNSGILHRVGPNRLYVKMARALADEGFPVFRFDLSGIGDSSMRNDHRPLQTRWVGEVREVMDALEARHGITRFGLTGICLGATLSFKTACEDPRVVGAALINAQDHLHDGTDELLHAEIRQSANARHNWRIAFSSSMSGQKWRKALRGEVDVRGVARLLKAQASRFLKPKESTSLSDIDGIEASFDALDQRGAKVLHIYSEGDVGLDYLELMLGDRMAAQQERGALQIETIAGSNHTFTLLQNQSDLIASVGRWASTLARG